MKIRKCWAEDNVGYVPLTRGNVAKVDAEDLPRIELYNWYALSRPGYGFYAENRTGVGDRKRTLHMHRFVLNVTDKNMVVDHINHDTLDNRKENLRVCKQSDNSKNCVISRNNKTGLKGVSFEKQTGRYKAQITVNYKNFNLGRYDTPEEAYKVYLDAAKKLYGEFSHSGVINA